MSDPFLGEIRIVAFTFAPQGWAMCNGQTLQISQNTALYALLGVQYGGDGVKTFNLPDLRSRVPIHVGQGGGLSNYAQGQSGGVENTTLTLNQLPMHTHAVNCNASPGTQASPAGAFWAEGPSAGRGSPSPNQYATSAGSTMAGTALSAVGGNQPFTNIQPYLVLNFIIALEGIFPPRQ